MRYRLITFVLLISLGFNLQTHASKKNEFDKVMKTISKRYETGQDPVKLEKNANKNMDLMSAEGAFSDIDYSDVSIAKWEPIKHLDRTNEMILAYTTLRCKLFANKNLYDKIVMSLEYWYAKDPKSDNWWHNQIAVPRVLGLSLIQMRQGNKKLSAELEKKLIDRMAENAGDIKKHVGANLTDIATDYFYRACLTKDAEGLEYAISRAFTPLKLVKAGEEGIKYDYSYQQHGVQLYIGGYGEELIKGVTNFALNLVGTDYELKGEQLNILSNFVRNTFLTTIRGQFMHYNVMGRSVSRAGLSQKTSFARFIKDMVKIDAANKSEYESAFQRMTNEKASDFKVTNRNILYPISDYSIHIRTPYSFSVRTVSNRTAYIEHGNNENLDAYFMTFGATAMMQKGDEYKDIFPVWNWTRIPGVTNPQVEEIPQRKKWGVIGVDKFSGGVSDSLYAVMAYSHTDTIRGKATRAKKSWFMFDDEIVCLGADINSESPYAVNTTVEQSLLLSEIKASEDNKEISVAKGEHQFAKGIDWAYHNGIGYLFPCGGNVIIGNQTQKGSWKYINTSQSDKEIALDVFTLYFDHGINPQNAKYAYIILPNQKSSSSVNAYKSEVEIVSNTAEIQAVFNNGLGILQTVFYEAGELDYNGIKVKVDKPCVLMLKGTDKSEVCMYLADPAQTRSIINAEVTIAGSKTAIRADFTDVEPEIAGFNKYFKLKK